MRTLGLKSAALGVLAAVSATAASQTITLTGINWFTLDSTGRYTGGYANTYGGDTASRNLYITENDPVGLGPLLNSGNFASLPTRVQVDLSEPGTYNFEMYCNGGSSARIPFWGLNLFFDGNDLQPGISVNGVVDTPGFQTIAPEGTPTLDPFSMGLVTSSGPGQQVFSVGGKRVTLTSYCTWDPTHFNLDRVGDFSDCGGLGNGTKDDVIDFSLRVSAPTPEPCSLGLTVGSVGLFFVRRRRPTRSCRRGSLRES